MEGKEGFGERRPTKEKEKCPRRDQRSIYVQYVFQCVCAYTRFTFVAVHSACTEKMYVYTDVFM